MSSLSRATRRAFLAALPAAALARPALAQRLPERPLRLVVPFTPGGISDIVARAMADALQAATGQPAVVENRAGAGGNVGAEYVARATPDGTVLLAVGPAVMGIARPLYAKLNYDPDRDFAPVAMMGAQANVLLANPAAFAGLDDLVRRAKHAPGRYNYGSGGIGSLAHLTGALFAADAGIDIAHVPYRGSPPAMADLVAGQIHLLFDAVTTALPLAQAGSVRMLGVATAARQPAIPDVPGLPERGFPGTDAPNWFGLFAPAGTPAPVLAALREVTGRITADPAWDAALKARSATPLPMRGEALDAFLAKERARWAETVQRSGARAD